MDERDAVISNLKAHVAWVTARAYATLEDMKGKFAEGFDPKPLSNGGNGG